MISPEVRAQIRRYFDAEHGKIGTIARELAVHRDALRNAIEAQRPGGKVQLLRPSVIEGDSYRAPRESEQGRRKP